MLQEPKERDSEKNGVSFLFSQELYDLWSFLCPLPQKRIANREDRCYTGIRKVGSNVKDYNEIFAANMRARRRELRLTQRALGERIGYSEKAVSKWESGAALPPSALLPAIAELLLTSIDELMRERDREIRYYLGVDGGGTKTEFVLTDEEGHVEARTVLGASNPNDVGIKTACAILGDGITEVCGARPRSSVSAFFGLAGGISGDNQTLIKHFLAQYHFGACENGSDAANAVAAALGQADGISVILGTGSITFSQCNGAQARHGGYGYLFGDGGSGFSLGRDAIAAALAAEDGSGPATLLREAVRNKCGGKTVLEKLPVFYESPKRTVASYAPLVFEAYAAGDGVAKAILTESLARIADTVRRAASRFDPSVQIPVVLSGGVSTHAGESILPILGEFLEQERYALSVCDRTSVEGALRLAGLEATLC